MADNKLDMDTGEASAVRPKGVSEAWVRPGLTVEQAAWAVVGLLAAAVRLAGLGIRPLSTAEATQALAAFRFTEGAAQTAPAGTLPALFTANAVGFTLFGANDASARLLPALAGLILVLLPYGLRHRLGRGGALAAALLLAFSPLAVYASRTLDGAGLVAACSLAVAAGMLHYLDTLQPRSLYLAAGAVGLGLCAGPEFLTALSILFLFGLAVYVAGRPGGGEPGQSRPGLPAAWWAARFQSGLWTRAALILAATWGLAATAFILHPAGLGHGADLIAAWAQSLWPAARDLLAGGEAQRAVHPALLMLRYEPLILLLALAALAGFRRGAGGQQEPAIPHRALLVFWAVLAGLFTLLPGQRSTANALLVVIPLALLAGEGIEQAWRRLARWQPGGPVHSLWVAATALGLLVFFYLQLAAYGEASSTATISMAGITLNTTTSYLILAAVVLLLLAALTVAVGFWQGTRAVVTAGWLVALAVLSLIGFKEMWALNFAHAGDPRELMIGQSTAPEVRLFVQRLEALSLAQSGDRHTLPVTVETRTGPVVAWYLREFARQTLVEELTAPPDTYAAVTLAVTDPPIGETFRGQGFPLRSHWLPWGLWGQDLARWLLFTAGSQPTVDQELVLWVASES